MLVEAAYWRPGTSPLEVDNALLRHDLTHLLADFGRPGDAGLVAEHAGRPLGATWFRLWTKEVHSYGFVDASTPELAIAVSQAERGQGVGTALLSRLLELARSLDLAVRASW